MCETHTAIAFFAGDRAYKVKKPVNLGFLDYTTRAARRTACERQVALNRRFAPDVCLGLGEFRGPGAEVPEPLVVMRRMPADRRLSRLVRNGAALDDVLWALARHLAVWHADAPRGPEVDAEGTRDALSSRWEASFAHVHASADDGSVPDGLTEVERLVHRYLAGRERLFASRIEQGRVVDGHGDLLAEDVFCLDDGPRVLDCLEFDDRLRDVDGLDDAAFLAMDLERLGAPAEGTHLRPVRRRSRHRSRDGGKGARVARGRRRRHQRPVGVRGRPGAGLPPPLHGTGLSRAGAAQAGPGRFSRSPSPHAGPDIAVRDRPGSATAVFHERSTAVFRQVPRSRVRTAVE